MCNQSVRHTALSIASLLPLNHNEAMAIITEVRDLVDWQLGNPAKRMPQVIKLDPLSSRTNAGYLSFTRRSQFGAAVAACVSFMIGWVLDPPWAGASFKCALAQESMVLVTP